MKRATFVVAALLMAGGLALAGSTTLPGPATVSGLYCALTGCTMTGNITMTNAASALLGLQSLATTGYSGFVEYDTASNVVGVTAYAGSTSANTYLADKVYMSSQGKVLGIVRQDNVAAGASLVEFWNNTNAVGSKVAAFDGVGNLLLNATATRSKGTVTLAAGAGSVTVAAGSICTCSDTTAAAAVKCSVASTTLSVTGTGTDVVAYLCM